MKVPLLDLVPQYQSLAEPIREAVLQVIDDQRFILGPVVEELEQAVTKMLGMKHAIGCASGTDALLLAYRAVGVERGEEVITSPFTFFATAGAIHNAGGRPVFADIDPDTYNLSPSAAEAAITSNTRAIVPVHLFGQMADMSAFRELGDRRGLAIVEDAAQAIGARQQAASGMITTGTLGDACTFSFFPSKNLGGFGDGGMIVTNDDALAAQLFDLRVHGGRQMYHHAVVGFNSRLDALQAAVLNVKLPYLEGWSRGRRENARYYDEHLADIQEIVTPVVRDGNESIYNQYTIRVKDGKRDALQAALREAGVGSSVYYPLPLHLQDCFRDLGYREGEFPESERAAKEVLSLPIYPELSEAQLDWVVTSIRSFYRA